MMVRKLHYRSDIDGLRAIAILLVLFFHLDYAFFGGGFVGVDIFFVISGFLITGLIKKELQQTGSFSFKSFYVRRFRRLFPALFVTLLVVTIIASLVMSPMYLSRFGGALSASIFSFSNIYFWFEADYFDASASLKPLLHTWSLSIEEQFYIIWPFVLVFLLKCYNKKIVLLFLMLSVCGSLLLNVMFSDGYVYLINTYLPSVSGWIEDGKSTIFFLLPFRVFEFAIGALLVWVNVDMLKSKAGHDLLWLVGLGLVGYAGISFEESMLFPSYYALAPVIGTALLIFSGSKSRLAWVQRSPLFVGIGLISYSLYLVHWPIIVFWGYFWGGYYVCCKPFYYRVVRRASFSELQVC